MDNKLAEIADVLTVYEIMEGSSKELEDVFDKYGDEPLTLLWDREPSELFDTPDTSSSIHEWVRIKESEEESEVHISRDGKIKRAKYRAFTYECRKCGSITIAPASENDLSSYGAPTCHEVIVEEIMNK